ncbi:MAG TPA: SHOCT domain-containing protein [Solirubrobacteraceae bacterium]|jgi:biotin carboxyl carrier protein|nr:SHOCT domain-containing protein [Solirubrobacteraceae bacterium]
MARVAVASGTWTAVSNRVSRRQANKWAAQDQQQYYQQQPQYQQPPPQYQQQPQYYQQPPAAAAAQASPPAAAPNSVQQLKDLADLKAQGVLTDQEFAEAKARILSA